MLTEAQRNQWDEEGYLVVARAYAGDDLQRLRAAFDRCAAEAKPGWLEGVAAATQPGAFFDIPRPLEKDDAFTGLARHPGYFGLLVDLLGEDLVFKGAQVRTLPVSPVSYVGWHPDTAVRPAAADQGPDLRRRRSGRRRPFCVRSRQPQTGFGSLRTHRRTGDHAGPQGFSGPGRHRDPVQHPRLAHLDDQQNGQAEKIDHPRVRSTGRRGGHPDEWSAIADKLTTPERRRLFSLSPDAPGLSDTGTGFAGGGSGESALSILRNGAVSRRGRK